MGFLDLSHLEKSFGTTRVVKDFNLSVEQGEFVSFLGPSGCGKTTVLRMVAGFETPSSGSIRIDGQEVTGLRPNQRNIGMVFQAYALFPNLTVAGNVGFGLLEGGLGIVVVLLADRFDLNEIAIPLRLEAHRIQGGLRPGLGRLCFRRRGGKKSGLFDPHACRPAGQ